MTCTFSERSRSMVSPGGSGENGDVRKSPQWTMKSGACRLLASSAASRPGTKPWVSPIRLMRMRRASGLSKAQEWFDTYLPHDSEVVKPDRDRDGKVCA